MRRAVLNVLLTKLAMKARAPKIKAAKRPQMCQVSIHFLAVFALYFSCLPSVYSARLSSEAVLELLNQQDTNARSTYVIVCWEPQHYEDLLRHYSHDRELDIHLVTGNGKLLTGAERDWQVAVYRAGKRNRHCLGKLPHPTLVRKDPVPELVFRRGDLIHYSLAQWLESNLNMFAIDSPEGKLLNSVDPPREESLSRRTCDRVMLHSLTAKSFFFRYVLPARPVVIEAGDHVLKGEFSSTWDLKGLVNHFGEQMVSVRAVPKNKTGVGVFEGCENAASWRQEGYSLPEHIREQLESPDLVLVRPAILERPLEEVASHISSVSNYPSNMSFYLEYFGLNELNPELSRQSAPRRLPFLNFARVFHAFEESRNLWLGDGRTIGKLHFDPQDNVLVQVKGSKVFTLFEPKFSEHLYEGHLREAQFVPDSSQTSLLREKFLQSTSMVNSPVDVENPDLTTYPKFNEVRYKYYATVLCYNTMQKRSQTHL